jgi:hypothetical protein
LYRCHKSSKLSGITLANPFLRSIRKIFKRILPFPA